jgi:hypothetical protein
MYRYYHLILTETEICQHILVEIPISIFMNIQVVGVGISHIRHDTTAVSHNLFVNNNNNNNYYYYYY